LPFKENFVNNFHGNVLYQIKKNFTLPGETLAGKAPAFDVESKVAKVVGRTPPAAPLGLSCGCIVKDWTGIAPPGTVVTKVGRCPTTP